MTPVFEIFNFFFHFSNNNRLNYHIPKFQVCIFNIKWDIKIWIFFSIFQKSVDGHLNIRKYSEILLRSYRNDDIVFKHNINKAFFRGELENSKEENLLYKQSFLTTISILSGIAGFAFEKFTLKRILEKIGLIPWLHK